MFGQHSLYHREDHDVVRSRHAAKTNVESPDEPSLWQRDFVLLLSSRSVSMLGSGMALVGIVYLIITVTDGALWV